MNIRFHSPFGLVAHVLAINELVEFRDKFGNEIRVVWYRDFLDTTRIGPDVVLFTLCCHVDGLPNHLVVKKARGKTSRHGSSDPLYVHLVSGPDNLEWSIIRHTSLFAEILHDDDIARCPTFQGSLGHLSGYLLGLCVPLLQWNLPQFSGRDDEAWKVLSNTPARHDVNVTEKFAVWRTRTKVNESDCARNDMGERQTQLLPGSPRKRSTRIYFNRKEDTGPQTPCSCRSNLKKSSQSYFLLPSKVLSSFEEKENNGFYWVNLNRGKVFTTFQLAYLVKC